MSKNNLQEGFFLLDISVEFSGHKLANVLMNASGIHCMTIKEMDELAASQAGAFCR